MEFGEQAEADAETLKALHDGAIEKDNKRVKDYLIKKL